MVRRTTTTLTTLLSWSSVVMAHYALVEDLTNTDTFWQRFDFYTGPDPTNGHVKFLDEVTANATGLVGSVQTNAGLGIYLGTDMKTTTPQGRPSIRLTSKKTHNHALWIMDIGHVPVAPGAWPALWLLGTSTKTPYGPWPNAGEIDIMEQVNNATTNRMTLHTRPGVTINNDTSAMAPGSSVLAANCDVNAPGQIKNQGCAVDQPEGTFGDAFNQNGGGVFAVEYTSQAIKIWFFARKNLPAGVDFNNPESTATWPKPSALFTGNNVNYDQYFCDMQLIIDLTWCGDWAGKVWAESGYSNLAPTCKDFVTDHPEALKEAYWTIYGVKVFEDHDGNSYPDTVSSASNTTSAASSSASTSGGAGIYSNGTSTSSGATGGTYNRRVARTTRW